MTGENEVKWDDLEDEESLKPGKPGGGYAAKTGYGMSSVDDGTRYEEDCDKCRGSGRFISWAGRDVGQCLKCKGKGKIAYKNPSHVREKQRQQRQTAKESKLQKKIDAFAEANPEVFEWMIGATSFAFAISLREALYKYGSLTPKQLAAAQKCVAKIAAGRAETKQRVQNAKEIDAGKIAEAFAHAKASGLKWPKLNVSWFQFKLAGAKSRNPGAIYVMGKAVPGYLDSAEIDGVYLGKVQDGKFFRSRDCTEQLEEKIRTVAEAPDMAAEAHGHLTGACSCCGRELTNPESVQRGIGPVCAAKYGW